MAISPHIIQQIFESILIIIVGLILLKELTKMLIQHKGNSTSFVRIKRVEYFQDMGVDFIFVHWVGRKGIASETHVADQRRKSLSFVFVATAEAFYLKD